MLILFLSSSLPVRKTRAEQLLNLPVILCLIMHLLLIVLLFRVKLASCHSRGSKLVQNKEKKNQGKGIRKRNNVFSIHGSVKDKYRDTIECNGISRRKGYL